MAYGAFTDLQGYVDRLKDEADKRDEEERRKREEEERRRQQEAMLAQWRRTTPIGPAPRDVTRATPGPDAFAIAKPQPNQQVGLTAPAVDTGTPQIGASNPMLATVAPPQSPTIEEPKKKRTEVRYDPLSSANPYRGTTGQPPPPAYDPLSSLNSWKRAAPNTPPAGAIQSPIPGMVGNAVQQGVQAASGFDLSQYIPQGLKDWAQEAFKPISEEEKKRRIEEFKGQPQPLTDIFEQYPAPWVREGTNPVIGEQLNTTRALINKRHEEERFSNAIPDFGWNVDLPGGYRYGTSTIPKAIAQTTEEVSRGLADITDLLGITSMANVKPYFAPDKTMAQLGAQVLHVGEGIKKDTRPGFEWMPGTDLNTWFSLADPQKVATLWDVSNKALIDATTPDAFQLRYTTPEQREAAKIKATSNALYGIPSIAGVYDDLLNNPVRVAQMTKAGIDLAKTADGMPDSAQKWQLYAQAGQYTANAAKLREMTDLDIYEQNSNFWNGLILSSLLDWGNLWEVSKTAHLLLPQARRMESALQLAQMAEDAPANFNRTVSDLVITPIAEALKLQHSKGATATNDVFNVLVNVASASPTKGDAKILIKTALDNKLGDGIAADLLNGAGVDLQKNAEGLLDFGQAGVRDKRFVKALPLVADMKNWIDNLPSLQGAADEAYNSYMLMSDLIGGLHRAASQYLNVSQFPGIPYGAVRFRVAPDVANAGQAAVQYIDNAGRVLGQSDPMHIRQAMSHSEGLSNALKAGKEYQTNWAEQVSNMMRNIQSTFSVNTLPNVIGNAVGGNVAAMMDGTWSPELMEKNVTYVMTKMGGFFPSTRMAEEIGQIKGPVGTSANAAKTTGDYSGLLGGVLNALSLGIAKPMKKLRTSTATIGGFALGEPGMAANIYSTAFKALFEQEWSRALPPVIDELLGGAVQDKNALQWITDHILQAGMAGGRLDIAGAINEIANGRISLALHTVAPTVGDVLTGQQVLDINAMLRNLNMETLPQVSAQIDDIFQTQRELLQRVGVRFPEFLGPRHDIHLQDSKDIADISNMFSNVAQLAGLNPDEANARGKAVQGLFNTVNQSMLNLAQMLQGQPNMMDYTVKTWNAIQSQKDATRAKTALLGQYAHEAVEALKDAERAASGDIPMAAVASEAGTMPPHLMTRLAEKPVEKGIAELARRQADLTNLVPPDMLDRMQKAFRLDKPRTSMMSSILSARAETWAKQVGKTPEEYFPMIEAFFQTNQTRPPGLTDDAFAWFSPAGKKDTLGRIAATVAMFNKDYKLNENDRFGILAHEIGHMFTMDMEVTAQHNPQVAKEWAEASKWAGFLNPQDRHLYNQVEYNRQQDYAHEKFADAFVNYLRSGQAPKGSPPGIQAIFEQFKAWLNTIQKWLMNDATGAASVVKEEQAQRRTFDFLLDPSKSKAGQAVSTGFPDYQSVFGGKKNLLSKLPGEVDAGEDVLREVAMAAPKKAPNPVPVLPQKIGPALDVNERINLTDARGTGNLVGRVTGVLTPDLTGQRGYGYEVSSYLETAPTWKKTIYDADLARQDDVVIQRFDKRGFQRKVNPNAIKPDNPRLVELDKMIALLESGRVPGFEGGSVEQTNRLKELNATRSRLLKRGESRALDLFAKPLEQLPEIPGEAATMAPAGAAPTSALGPIYPPEAKRPYTKGGKEFAYFGQARGGQEIDPITKMPKPIEVNPEWVNSVHWKIHLNTTNEDDAVMRLNDLGFLHQKHADASLYSPKIFYKFANEGGGPDKGLTIYVGSRDRVNEVAQLLSKEMRDINKPAVGDMLKDDIELAPGIYGRFDAGTTDGMFHRYGSKGHPALYTDIEARVGGQSPLSTQQMAARADKLLRERYGEYYTGTGVTQQVAPGLAQGIATPPVAAAATQPLEEAIWRAGDTDFPIKITGVLGEHNGEKYYSIEGSSTGVPESQIIRTPQAAEPPAARTMEDVINEAVPPTTPAKAPRKGKTPAAAPPAVPPAVPPTVPPGIPPVPPGIPPTVPAVPPAAAAGPSPLNEQAAKIWADTFEKQHQAWVDFGKWAGDFISKARDDIPNVQQRVSAGLPPIWDKMVGVDGQDIDLAALEAMSNTEIDWQVVDNWLNTKVGWASKDPAFKLRVNTLRQGVDRMQQAMMQMMLRHPTTASLGEFNQAYEDVKVIRNRVLGGIRSTNKLIADAQDAGDTYEESRLFDRLLEQQNNGWGQYFNAAIERYWAGAVRIGEVNLPPEIRQSLTFRPAGATADWTLVGPDFLHPKKWQVMDEKGVMTTLGVGAGMVPKPLLERYNAIRKAAEFDVMQQVENLGLRQGRAAVGNPDVDEIMRRMKLDPRAIESLNNVRKRVADMMSQYAPQTLTPAELAPYMMGQLDAGQHALQAALTDIAQMNAQGFGKMGLDTMGNMTKKILPLFDNIITGAQRYGHEMTSFGMVDFTNQYHPDTLLSLYAPFHYWWTRMGKNALERMLFNPKVSRLMAQVYRSSEMENRRQDQPNRNIDTFPIGITIGDTEYRPGLGLLPRWIPYFPQMVMSGWGNADRANRSYEYMAEASKQQSWPATMKGIVGGVIAAHELAKQMGLSSYAGYDYLAETALAIAGGKPIPDPLQGAVGDMSSLYKTLGYGVTAFANWMKEQGRPLAPTVQEATDWVKYLTLPEYAPYLSSRGATAEVVRGNLTENEGSFVQDVLNQGVTGRAPMPEQALMAPQAERQTAGVEAGVFLEYFIKNLISWVSGAPVASISEPELQMRAAKEEQAATKYAPVTQEGGSQSAFYGMTDPGSPNYTPGLRTANSQYAVTMEAAAGVPDEDADRPALGAVQNEYFDRRKVITDKYLAEEAAAYKAHPEWGSPDGEPPTKLAGAQARAFRDSQKAKKDEELKTLDAQFPTVAGKYGVKNTMSEFGARPAEVVDDAQKGAYQRAVDNLKSIYPGDSEDATQADWDRYEAALLAETDRLMKDPNETAAILFGSEESINRDIARHRLQQPGTKTAIPAGQPATNAASPSTSSVPAGPYGADFAAAEQKYGLPPGFLDAMATKESNQTPKPKNNSFGMMQIEDAAWNQIMAANPQLTDREDPKQAIEGAGWYLNWVNDQLKGDKKGDPFWLAAAYNMGVTAVNAMTNPEDILNYKTYPEQRLQYAKDIAAASGAAQPAATTESTTPMSVMPFEGDYPLTQEFGVNPERYKSWGGHMGLDFKMPEGTPVLASQDGVVLDTGWSPKGGTPSSPGTGGFGNWVIVQYPGGYTAEYAHFREAPLVKKGDKVTARQSLGLSGDTGVSDFPHLHFGVRKDGKYIDPHEYLDMMATTAPTTTAPTTPSVAAVAPAIGATPEKPARTQITPSTTTPTTAGGFPFTKTAEQIVAEGKARGKSPERVAAEGQVDVAFQAIEDRANATYPEWATLYQEYKGVHDADKKQWTADNPMIRALNMAGYNPDEWAKLEKDFGKGIVEKWAQTPPYNGVDSDDRSLYYHQYPKVFTANAWIKGRPEVYDENAYDPLKQFEYNFGKDYEEAKQRYGDDIWNTVEQYYKNPAYVKGGDNSVWLKFKQDHPEYDQWRNWWYEKLGLTTKPFVPYQAGGFSGGYGHSKSHPDPSASRITEVPFQRQEAPRWQGGSGDGGGDWRKYFNVPEPNLRGWRR